MPPFVSPPPSAPRPQITLGRLVEVVGSYLRQEHGWPYNGWLATYDRSSQSTDVRLGSDDLLIGGVIDYYSFPIDGNRTRDGSKLDPGEIIVHMCRSLDRTFIGVVVEPQADRSVMVYKIIRWENGIAHYSRD